MRSKVNFLVGPQEPLLATVKRRNSCGLIGQIRHHDSLTKPSFRTLKRVDHTKPSFRTLKRVDHTKPSFRTLKRVGHDILTKPSFRALKRVGHTKPSFRTLKRAGHAVVDTDNAG